MRLPLPGPLDVLHAAGGLRDGVLEALALLPRIGAAVGQVEELLTQVSGLMTRVEVVVDRAEVAVAPLLDAYRPTLAALEPAVTRMAQHLDDDEVQALITLVDRLPTLVRHLDEDVLPVLAGLGNVAPDVHELRDTVQDLRQVVKGFPGSRLFRRRGAEEIAQEEADEAQEDREQTGS